MRNEKNDHDKTIKPADLDEVLGGAGCCKPGAACCKPGAACCPPGTNGGANPSQFAALFAAMAAARH